MTAPTTPPNKEAGEPADEQELKALYQQFDAAHMIPLWTQIDDLMPHQPTPRAVPYLWHWSELYPLAKRSGDLVPVGRGGERRAIALANPGLGGMPFATPTLWAAIQYLGPHEVAPEHRHTQNAFRFVLEGEGVWTVVNGDPVAMRRGDFLLTPGWNFHGHQNVTSGPMAWLDGLDIPMAYQNDTGFFEFGPDDLTDTSTPERSRAERLWAHPGLQPVALLGRRPSSPIAAYRWEHTDRALTEQLALEDEGYAGTVEAGHAAVRFTNPTTGGDVLPTIRADFHRLRAGTATAARQEVGSSVWQVFTGRGTAVIGGVEHTVEHGDVFVVPSWARFELRAEEQLDLFRFSDAPVFEALNQFRQTTGTEAGA
nr:cupin domain-containing protein [Streptomyces sp. NBC_00886]